ncbi:MAG: hypothetical protein HOE90_04600 [Bacteriovoracaceae bacterium]|nr:hypothetical protein [Bacteriovoracaceae bacterium]
MRKSALTLLLLTFAPILRAEVSVLDCDYGALKVTQYKNRKFKNWPFYKVVFGEGKTSKDFMKLGLFPGSKVTKGKLAFNGLEIDRNGNLVKYRYLDSRLGVKSKIKYQARRIPGGIKFVATKESKKNGKKYKTVYAEQSFLKCDNHKPEVF